MCDFEGSVDEKSIGLDFSIRDEKHSLNFGVSDKDDLGNQV